jgi:predicted RNA-binding protein with PUA-like domain
MPQTSSKTSESTSVRYWLLKSEPTVFSIDDLASAPKKTSSWEGVRNYQARNMLRDDFQKGDRVLFYHSSCAEPAVVGTATVAKAGYPDHSALDPKHHYYDEKSTAENPRWYMVDIKLEKKFARPVTLAELRKHMPLAEMLLLRKGSRLSVQPLKQSEFDEVVRLSQTS